MELLPLEKVISILKEKGINLGKGNPYNRLRYYTKIGWIPHMTRKKNEHGVITGHYPRTVIDQIIKIENFKKNGKNNEDISKEISNNNVKTEGNIWQLFKKININIIFMIIILAGIILEFYRYNSPNEKNSIQNEEQKNALIPEKKIIDSGIGFIPSSTKEIFIPTSRITPISIILVNFYDNLGYNNSYFIREVKPNQGFFIELQYPINKESKLNWVIIE